MQVAAPVVVAAPAVGAGQAVGMMPVRSGLFGWRTTWVPVLPPVIVTPSAISSTSVLPTAVTGVPNVTGVVQTQFTPGTLPVASGQVMSARPTWGQPVWGQPTWGQPTWGQPSDGITGGFIGQTVSPPTIQVVPINTFHPQSVMSMQ